MVDKPLQTLGIIADTHIPDRTNRLHPEALVIFEQSGVEAILHAGDISAAFVLAQLERIAPVFAVRGNRDWIWLRHLPGCINLTFSGVPLVLTHGHGDLLTYLRNHLMIKLKGYQPELFVKPLFERHPEAKVVVFGHTHIPYNQWVNGRLFFNPGSSYISHRQKQAPSVGLLHFYAEGCVKAEIVELA
jgi:putative phosphoesterase